MHALLLSSPKPSAAAAADRGSGRRMAEDGPAGRPYNNQPITRATSSNTALLARACTAVMSGRPSRRPSDCSVRPGPGDVRHDAYQLDTTRARSALRALSALNNLFRFSKKLLVGLCFHQNNLFRFIGHDNANESQLRPEQCCLAKKQSKHTKLQLQYHQLQLG